MPLAKVNAKQVRQFAKACGELAKTDRIDAFILADYGRRIQTRILPRHSSQLTVLKDLVLRYRQLSHMIVQEKNRREKLTDATKGWVEETLRFRIDQRQAAVEKMTACLKADPELGRKAEVLMSLKGHRPAHRLLPVSGPAGLGLMNKGQIAKLVGVAPLNRDSGLMREKRIIAGGRKPVRDALYSAALPAIRFDPGIKAFYTSLRATETPGKVALVAVMRKMIVILNARMRDNAAAALDSQHRCSLLVAGDRAFPFQLWWLTK